MPRFEFTVVDPVYDYTIIPIQPGELNYSMLVAIGGVTYTFESKWNETNQSHYLNVMTEIEEPIRMGMRVTLGVPLGRTSTHPFFTDGRMVARDLSGQKLEPGRDDFGTRVELRYYTLDQYLHEYGLTVKQVP